MKPIPRKLIRKVDAMECLSIRSRTTFASYCKDLGIPLGGHWVTEEQYNLMAEYRAWIERGFRKKDFIKRRGGDIETQTTKERLLSLAS